MTAPILRDYQETWIGGLRAAFSKGFHSPLGVLPTGGGKTVCFSYLTSRLVQNGKRVVLLCHRDFLLEQISKTLAQFNVRHGLIASETLYDRRLMAHVASVNTLVRNVQRFAVPDYVIVDEAHHCIAKSMWGKVIAAWRTANPALRVIGVTATPIRLSGEGLGDVFDEMVLGPTTRDLIERGALSKYRLFLPQNPIDFSGIKIRAGDYAKGEVSEAMQDRQIVGNTVSEYRAKLNGAPTVTFEVSVKNAVLMAEKFRAEGFTAAHIDGKMSKDEIRQVIRDFESGRLNLLTTCDIASEGLDIPGIIGVIQRRPTWSLMMDRQQKGRGFRLFPGKEEAIFIDQVGNAFKHGLPDDPKEWSLFGEAGRKGKKKTEDNVAARQCVPYEAPEAGRIRNVDHEKGDMIGGCYAVSAAAAAKCRECETPFLVKARTIEEVAGSLSEVDVAKMRQQAVRDQAAARTLEDLIRLGTQRGMSNPAGWARHVHAARQAKQARG